MKKNIYEVFKIFSKAIAVVFLLMLSNKALAQATYTFGYTGATQSLSLLAGTYSIEAWGW